MNNYYLFFLIFLIHFALDKNKKKIFNDYFLDIPNLSRKIHKEPTYLIGGHFIFISYSVFLLFSFDHSQNHKLVFFFIFSCIFLIGILDDLKDLKPIVKLGLVLIIYLVLIHFDNDYLLKKIYFETFDRNFNFGIYSYLVSILCVLLLINAINLIDGINGLAMMIFIIIYLFLWYFLNISFNAYILIFYLFVFFNIFKGKYFLGNSGSLIIGALIAFSTIKAYNSNFIGNNSAEDIFILFLIPGIDMLRLFVQRIVKRKNPFEADRSHLHHLLIKRFPLQKILFGYFFMIVISSYAAFNDYLPEIIIILAIITIYSLTLYLLNKIVDK
jgi:UDP-GlcNAc:undecaprenyl-phosphate/decaprenyl-phosphate GlcNAc-1-phosphate transferase